MFHHPAYPSSADLAREADAEDRDLADLVALRELRGIVADAMARASRVGGIRHPDRRWSGAPELIETLQGELLNIDGTIALVMRGPVVIEENA
jgi:hypothetical protein